MSRYSGFFGSSTTTTTNPVRRVERYTIEDLYAAIIDNNEKLVMEILISGTISVNQTIDRDPYRNTLLHTAIDMGNVKIIQKLIDMGADLRIRNKKGESSADKLSKSHLGEVIQYIYDKDSGKLEELKKEIKEKDGRIRVLEENVTTLESSNKRIYSEKQNLEVEVIQLRKRKIELEDTNSMLRQATKKPKN